MLKKAGIDEASFKNLTWNPQDGGTFLDLIKKLTLDSNGNNATSASFDKTKVVQYGFIPVGLAAAGNGQTEWSWLAVPNGFKYNDGPWSTKYYYDDPKFIEAIQWYRRPEPGAWRRAAAVRHHQPACQDLFSFG